MGLLILAADGAKKQFGVVLLFDTFTDTNGVDLVNHVPDIGPPWNDSGQLQIQSNTAVQSVSGNPGCNRDAGQANTVSDATISVNATGSVEIWVRESDDNNRYEFQTVLAGANEIDISKKVAGSYTSLGSLAVTFSAGTQYPVQIVCAGASMTFNFNSGAGLLSVNDSTFLNATKYGIGGNKGGGTSPISRHKVRSWPLLGAPNYLLPTFTGNGATQEVLRLLQSPDGVTWEDRPTVYTPTTGFLRDPALLAANGVPFLYHTNINSDNTTYPTYCSVATGTSDLSSFTPTAHIDFGSIGSVLHVWAPKPFVDVDGTPYLTANVATGSGSNDQPYVVHPTNAGQSTWSLPTAIGTSGLPAFLIDWFQWHSDGTYYAIYRNCVTNYLEVASSSSPFSGFTPLHTGDWAGWGQNQWEAPSVVRFGGNHWRVYADKYSDFSGLHYSDSFDSMVTWSAMTPIATPYLARSGVATQYVNPGRVL